MGLVCDQLGGAIEREEAARALERSEEKFRNLIEGSIQGIYLHRDGVVIFANQALADIFGYDHPDDILELGSVDEFVAPYERQRLQSYGVARIRGEEAPLRHVAEYLRKDGSTVFLESINNLVDWDGGAVIQSAVIDVTEQVRAEDALHDRERQLRLIIDSIPVLITYVDSALRYRFVNETAEKWYGRPRAEIVGKSLRELWGADAYAAWKPHLESIREGWPQTFDETITYPDGRTREVTESWVPHVAEDGAVLGYFAVVQDFTSRRQAEHALRESEQRLKAILDNAPVNIYLKDTEGRYQVVNRAFEQNFVVTAREAEGHTPFEALPFEPSQELEDAEREVIETKGVLETEYHFTHNDRTYAVVKFPFKARMAKPWLSARSRPTSRAKRK
jgi:PAS domain S-box-containing protein